jgi:long-chain fatty acid transport protein
VGRYRFNDVYSAHIGVRTQTMEADVTLSGQGFGPLSGYNVALTNGSGTGWLAGVAYDRPDIALRVALTYNSAIENTFDAVESVSGTTVGVGTTTVTAPESWNLDFQTGIAADTLLFGQIRHAKYSQTILSPDFFNGLTSGGSITNIDDGTAYSIGVGRRFSDQFSASISVGYEPEGEDDLVSPLAPANGNVSLALGGQYTMGNVVLSGGLRYTMLGDARPEVGTTALGQFEGSTALAAGLSVGYRF